VEPRQFDALVASLFVTLTRRQLAWRAGAGAIGGGAAALAGPDAEGKKKKKKKKRTNLCRSFGNLLLECDPGSSCCDACSSTVAACRDPGFPVCCVSNGFSHRAGSRCCTSFSDGLEGFCPPDAPACCSGEVGGGCCPAEFPVCCDFDCCTLDDFCAEDGFCFFGFAAREAGAEDTARSGQGRKKTRIGDSDQRRRIREPVEISGS
jgi:hypothetical protein